MIKAVAALTPTHRHVDDFMTYCALTFPVLLVSHHVSHVQILIYPEITLCCVAVFTLLHIYIL